MELIALLALFGGSIAAYFKDLGGAVKNLQSSGGSSAMAKIEADCALAEILTLAVFADRRIDDVERAMLHRTLREWGMNGDVEIARISALAASLTTVDALSTRVTMVARRLDDDGRATALRLVRQLANNGSQLRVEGGYRGDGGSSEALVAVFEEALSNA